MRKAYSYIRMSTETQLKGDSLRRQLEASETYARNNQLELVDSIGGIQLRDIGVSGYQGKNTQKGVLAVFLDALEQGKIKPDSVLLIESLDRLSRDSLTKALSQFINILEKGVEIVTLADNQKYTQESINQNAGSMFVSLGIMFRANEESETKSKRLKAAWSNKRANIDSKVLTRTCPAWLEYSEETGKFEFVEDREKVVKLIFDMCINSCGLYSISRYLNANKVPVFGDGKMWYLSYVRKIISNRAVTGEFQPHQLVNGKREKYGDPIPNYFPAVVDESQFLLAQVAIANRTLIGKGRKGTSFTNLFAGITYCGECGFKMKVRNRGGDHRSSKYLICSNKMSNAGCEMPEWNLADFEASLFHHIRDINFDELMDTNNQDKEMSLTDRAEVLGEKLRSKEQEFERAMDSVVAEDLLEAVKLRLHDRMNKLAQEIAEIKLAITETAKLIEEEKSVRNSFHSTTLKELLSKIDTHQDDYYFRSSMNQLLLRMIEKLELFDSHEMYMPWEIREDDREIQRYRKTQKIRMTRSLEDIVESADFQQFYHQFHRKIKVTYKSGGIRHILCGDNISFGPIALR